MPEGRAQVKVAPISNIRQCFLLFWGEEQSSRQELWRHYDSEYGEIIVVSEQDRFRLSKFPLFLHRAYIDTLFTAD